jgi:hypothetical protein
LALFLVVATERLLQTGGEPLVGAVRGGDEGRQSSQFEEAAQGSETGNAELLKDDVECEQELFEESEPAGGFQEGDEASWGVGVLLALFPVAERRVWQARRGGEVAAGLVFVVRMEAFVEVADRFGACIAKGLFRGRAGRGRVAVTHGSYLLLGCVAMPQ